MNIDIADFVGGSASGAAAVLVGQPFDVVIVRLQTAGASYNHSMVSCVKSMYHNEGPRSFYRGLLPPLVSYGCLNAILFGTYATTRKALAASGMAENGPSCILLSGLAAGSAMAVACAPVELLKCRAQAKLTAEQAAIELNPFRCAKHIVATRGVSGLFTGFHATVFRDGIGSAVFFLSYEMLCEMMGLNDSPPNTMTMQQFAKLNLAGGFAGTLAWLSYPFDVIKSRIQTQSLHQPEYKGVIDCARKIVAAEGVVVLFRGLGATILQSFPVGMVTFGAYELVLYLFNGRSAPAPPPTANWRHT